MTDDYTERLMKVIQPFYEGCEPSDKEEVMMELRKQVERLQEKMYCLGGISQEEKALLEETIIVSAFRIDWERVWKEMGWGEEEEEPKTATIPWDDFVEYFGEGYNLKTFALTFKKYVEDECIEIEYEYEDNQESEFIRLRWRPVNRSEEFPYGKGHLTSFLGSSKFALWWSQYDE